MKRSVKGLTSLYLMYAMGGARYGSNRVFGPTMTTVIKRSVASSLRVCSTGRKDNVNEVKICDDESNKR